MERHIPIAYKSKLYPKTETTALFIDTDNWGIGFAHYENPITMSIDTEIQFLCFALRWRKFIEDIQKEVNNE